MCSPLHQPDGPLPAASRRTFLRATGLTGNGDAWADTWCYTNPVFVDVVR